MPSSSIAREMEKQKKRRGEEIKTGSFCWVKLKEESAEEIEDLLERYRSRTKTKADLKIMLRDQDVHLNANKCVLILAVLFLQLLENKYGDDTDMHTLRLTADSRAEGLLFGLELSPEEGYLP